MRATNISNSDNVIDSRDVIKRIDELDSDRETLADAVEAAQDAYIEACGEVARVDEWGPLKAQVEEAKAALSEYDEGEEGQELKALKALAEQADGYGDWAHGETLIRDGYFERYAQELAEECGDLKDCDHWPLTCIDWERAADELKQDYTEVDYDGEAYWMRA